MEGMRDKAEGKVKEAEGKLTDDELREFLAPNFAKWWLPDRFEFVEEIPKTAVGKFRKTALRAQFATSMSKRFGSGSKESTDPSSPVSRARSSE